MKKILIIRCLQTELVLQFISSIDEDIEIFILDNLKQNEFFEKEKKVIQIFNSKKKTDFSIFNIKLKTLLDIRKKKFDNIIIPHKQKKLNGLENIIFMSLFFNSKKINHFQFFHGVSFDDLNSINKMKFIFKMTLNYSIATILFPITVFFLILMILIGLLKKNQ